MKTVVFLVMIVIFMSGCATTNYLVQLPVQSEFVIAAPYESVRLAVMESIADLGLPIEPVDKEGEALTTQVVTVPWEELVRIAEVPVIPDAIWYEGRYALEIFLSAIDEESTRIKITIDIDGYEGNVTKKWYICFSRGVLEREIVGLIESKLK